MAYVKRSGEFCIYLIYALRVLFSRKKQPPEHTHSVASKTHSLPWFSLLPHASWATPRVGPMIRMALTHAVRRGLATSIHTHWHRDAGTAGGAGEGAE